MQRGPNWSALRAPVQFFTGCGSLHRSSPTGGCANGIPLKTRTPELEGTVDSTAPLAIFTRSEAEAPPAEMDPKDMAIARQRMRFMDVTLFTILHPCLTAALRSRERRDRMGTGKGDTSLNEHEDFP